MTEGDGSNTVPKNLERCKRRIEDHLRHILPDHLTLSDDIDTEDPENKRKWSSVI